MTAWRVLLSGGAIAVAGLLASQAVAQTDSSVINRQSRGFYIGGGVGLNIQDRNKFSGPGINSATKYEPGIAGLLNFGYALGNGLRFELEPSYRYNEVHVVAGSTVPAGGHSQIAALMANAIYDIDVHTPFVPLLPHVGVGAGVAHIWDREGVHNGLSIDKEDTVPAFQAIAGVDYALTPSMKVGLDYRYFVAHDADFRASNGVTAHAGDFNDHTVLLTFRYEFGAPQRAVQPAAVTPPPPPPPPVPSAAPAAPPPPVQQSYQVYFDLNSSRLTPTARAVVRQAATKAQQGQVSRINVTGHTDTTGTAAYNQRLSIRRADAVKSELVRDGVPADQISTVGRGEEGLAVPTANGVNEPRNRRVEIVLQSPGS